jgi:hypothetical protein
MALLVAVVFTVLVLIALAVGADGASDLGDTGVDEDQANGLGVLLGMPFQLVAMGLFGVLHWDGGDGAVSLFGLPLALTIVYATGVAWVSSRLERRRDSGSHRNRWVVALTSGVVAAVVVELVTWALAMRAEGEAVHGASVGLFLGTVAVTGLAAFVARARVVGARRPAWVSRDVLAAGRLWVLTVAAWVAVALPVLFVVAWVKAGFGAALTLPVWGPTVALWTFAVGHVSGISVSGGVEGFSVTQTASPWDALGAWGFLAAALLSLTLAVLAMVAWDRVRTPLPARDQELGAFATLPLTYAGGALALCLVTVLHAGGSLADLGGGATVQVAIWSPVVFLVWGCAVEAGARYLAPAVAPLLPSWALARLGAPSEDREVTTATPLTPRQRRRALVVGAVAGGAVVAVIALTAVVSWLNAHSFGPGQAAEGYLEAVASGDVDRVVSMAPAGDEASDALLDEAVYRGAKDRLTDFDVTGIERDGDTARVTFDAVGVPGGRDVTLTLHADGSRFVVFDKWKVTENGLLRTLNLDPAASGGALAVNDHEVDPAAFDEAGGAFWVLPGTYLVDPFAGNAWVESDPVATTVGAEPYASAYAETGEPQPSQRLLAEVQSQLDAWLDECMSSTDLEPEGCPQSAYSFYDEVRQVRWTLTEQPTVSLSYWGGSFPADFDVEGGEAAVTYQENQSFFPGDKPDWQRERDTSSLYVQARVDVVGDDVRASFSSY